MLKKFKFKFYAIGVATGLLISLTGCAFHSAHTEQGYTQQVIYDLGEGVCTVKNNRETNKLTIYYLPGSHIVDFSKNKDYVFTRNSSEDGTIKYAFAGWYLDANYETPVNFEEYTLPSDKDVVTTIYAKWEEVFDKHFNLYYQQDGSSEFTLLESIQWELEKPFKISEDIQYPSKDEYTFVGAYTDEAMTKTVGSDYLLTKDGEDLPIYTKWIKGHYKVVSTASEFRSYFDRYAISYDLYINADIDLSGVTLPRVAILSGRTILGNNHTISNLSYTTLRGENGSKTTVTLGGFADTIENCTIKDLKITNAVYTMHVVTCKYLQFGALAGTIKTSTIDNVSIDGTIEYAEDTLKRLENGELIDVRIKNEQLAYAIDDNSKLTNDVVNLKGLKEE